jgi:hypothetical protein
MASQPGFPAECPKKDKRTMTADSIQITIRIRAAMIRARLTNDDPQPDITRDAPPFPVRNGPMMPSMKQISSDICKY